MKPEADSNESPRCMRKRIFELGRRGHIDARGVASEIKDPETIRRREGRKVLFANQERQLVRRAEHP